MARKYGRRGRRGFGALPMNIDAPLAPGVGAATALIAASLARYYGKAGGFVVGHSGAVGAGAGIIASVVYGIARGMGAGIASGVSALAVGGGFELMQAVVQKRATSVSSEVTSTPPAGTAGLGFVRARMLGGYGAPRGFLPSVGSSPMDALRTGIAVPAV